MTTAVQRPKQRGLALLDALLALSVLSISVWGVQQLLAHRTQQATNQHQHAQAMALLNDLAQRVRIHALRFGYESTQALFASGLQTASNSPTDSCQAHVCDASLFAQWVLANWAAAATQALPDAKWRIQVQGQRLQLLLAWPQPGMGSYKWQAICPAQHNCEVLWL